MFCLAIIPICWKETTAYTTSTAKEYRKSFQYLFSKFSKNFSCLTFCIWALSLNTANWALQTHPVPLRFCIEKTFHSKKTFLCKILLNFSHLKLSYKASRSHNYLIKGTKRHTCEALSPCSPLSIVESPMIIIVICTS